MMTHDENCIFCKIINGELPSAKVYEDDHVYAFLDISQVTKGHTFVIKKTYNPIGMNLLNNNEKPADQSVFHLHIHLLPRYGKSDGFSSNWTTHEDDYEMADLEEIAKAIGENTDK